MKTVKKYHWRYGRFVCMLEEPEWLAAVERIRVFFERMNMSPFLANYRAKSEMKKQLTEVFGEDVELYQEIYLRRAWLVGPPCETCGRNLRTPNARTCVETDCHPASSPNGIQKWRA